MTSINLLFFASDFKIGLSTVLTDQLIAINKLNKIKTKALAGEKEQEEGLQDKISENKIDLEYINGLDEHRDFLSLTKIIAAKIIEQDINIIHVQNNWQLALVAYAKLIILRTKRIKIVYTIHGFRHNYIFKKYIYIGIIGLGLFLLSDKIIYMSEYVKKYFNFLTYKMTRVYLGIDDNFFVKQQNSVNVSPLKMIFPAQFRIGKNQDLIIRAFYKFLKSTNDSEAMLYLPGSGDLKIKCEELVKLLKIEKQVIFPGLINKNEVLLLFENCNIGIIASNSETYGQSIVEPFVLGKCLLSRKVGVASDIIKENENGYFFDNEDDLFEILIKLRNNPNIINYISGGAK